MVENKWCGFRFIRKEKAELIKGQHCPQLILFFYL